MCDVTVVISEPSIVRKVLAYCKKVLSYVKQNHIIINEFVGTVIIVSLLPTLIKRVNAN